MAISVRVNGIDAANHSIVSLTPTMASTVLKRMSQIAFDQMQSGAGKHSKSGNLFASVYNRITGPMSREVGHDPARLTVNWNGGTNRAIFVLFGTRPHVIRPRNKKVLRWPSGGAFAFAKQVNHPGYSGDNYMQRAADEAVRQFDAIVNQAFKEAT